MSPDPAPRRYFDNAATSHPKPPQVLQAICDYVQRVGASAGRGAYREALESGRIVSACRTAVRRVLGCRAADHVVFALNGTDALNTALKSVLRAGDHVVTTWMDHNSVLRPLSALEQKLGLEWTAVRPDPHTTLVSVDDIALALRRGTRMVVLSHASNVTGAVQPIEEIGQLCRERGVLLLIDAAQSAGHLPTDFSTAPIDMLACPGHKGLLGPLGTGVLVIRGGLEERLATVREGGTGSVSERPVQPEELPDRLEAGSHNALGLAGLLAALEWIGQRGVAALRRHELDLMERMIPRLEACSGLRWFGPRDPARRVGVFSVRIEGLDPAELSALLEERFGLLTRSGLHCAPFAHRTIGTDASGGTTRLSLGPFLEEADVDAAADALTELGRSSSRVLYSLTK
jgi:cysteine desulfurase/selenocysteine lyase